MRWKIRLVRHLIFLFGIIFPLGTAGAWVQTNLRDLGRVRNVGLHLEGGTITFSLEQDGSFDITDGSDLTAIRNSFQTINNVSTSYATAVEGPLVDMPADIDSEAGIDLVWDENRIYFFQVDSDGSFDALAAAFYTFNADSGTILACDVAFNNHDYLWSTATPADPNQLLPANTYDIQSVATHEIQHCFGLEHSALAGNFDASTGLELDGSVSGDYSLQASMFPYAAPNIQGRTLEPDDIAGLSAIYPTASAATTFGSICGRVLRSDGTGVKGAHLVAVLTSQPTHPRIGAVSGVDADLDPGGYCLTGLAPGDYYVRVEPLAGTSNAYTELNTGFFGFDTSFPPEFYSGPEESAVDATLAATDAAAITIAAGAAAHDIDVIVNPASVGAALNFLPARLAFVGVEGGANPPGQSFTVKNVGTGSPDWFVSGTPSWLSVGPGTGMLTSEGDLVTVSAKLAGLAAGTYRAKLAVAGVGADNSAQAVSVILVVAPSVNAIRTVCASGCSYTTIQGAIDAAAGGDIVQVGPGHYAESVVMKDGVKLVGAGAGISVIDAGGSGIAVTCASNALLDGFTVTGGNNTTVTDVTFNSFYTGSGVLCVGKSNTEISHDLILNNQIPKDTAEGAGIYAEGSPISILDNTIRGNVAGEGQGWNIYGVSGGGIYFDLGFFDPAGSGMIARNRILDNTAFAGGGIDVTAFSRAVTISDNVMAGNSVNAIGTSTGGGMRAWSKTGATISIVNNTVVGNFNSLLEGNISGIECILASPSQLANNIVWGNRAFDTGEYFGEEISTCPDVTYSTVAGGYTGTGNTDADPLFVDEPNRDFRLQASSPAIDAGSNSAPGISSYDLSGLPRILDGNDDTVAVTDMGAYEVGAPPPPPAVSLSPKGGLSFAARQLGNTSPANPLTLTNSGFSPLKIWDLTIAGGNAGDFAKSHNCQMSPDTVGTSSFCTISITFTPAAPGPRKAVLRVTSDAPGSPHRIMLTGLGSALGLSTTSLTFPSQPSGTTSAPQTVTVHNYGSAPVSVWSAAMGGINKTEFNRTNSCPVPPATLAAGASCTMGLRFSPATAGGKTAALLISHDGGGSPAFVNLTGTASSALQSQTTDSPVLIAPIIVPGTAQATEDSNSSADDKRKARANAAKERSEPR